MARTARRDVIGLLIEKQVTYTEAEADALIAQAKRLAKESGRTVRAEAALLLSRDRETRLRDLQDKVAETNKLLAAISVEIDDLRAESGDDDGALATIMATMATSCGHFTSKAGGGATSTTTTHGPPAWDGSERHTLRMNDPLGVRRDERETLEGFLDWYRAVVERKIDGLTLADATRVTTPTGMSALGVLKHLGCAERRWFRETFAGGDVAAVDVDGDNSPEFIIGDDDTVESVMGFYLAEVEHSRRVLRDAPSLDALSAKEALYRGHITLRWIVVHMLEETARHAGHLDLMRENVDGQVGD